MKSEKGFEDSLKNKKIPVLTLDNTWYKLFSKVINQDEIENLQEELNSLLKKQGKYNTELKDIKKIKSRLMNEIVEIQDGESLSEIEKEKKLNDNKRLINECNEKTAQYEDELLDFPKMIDEANRKLMTVTMSTCYDAMNHNQESIEEIAKWITEIRVELKKKLIQKQKMELQNREMYTYMHQIFGAEVVDLFDLKYNPMKPDAELDKEHTEQN